VSRQSSERLVGREPHSEFESVPKAAGFSETTAVGILIRSPAWHVKVAALNAEQSNMKENEEFNAVSKSIKRLSVLAFVLGVLHGLGQLFLARHGMR
jgi:hypothetical protein